MINPHHDTIHGSNCVLRTEGGSATCDCADDDEIVHAITVPPPYLWPTGNPIEVLFVTRHGQTWITDGGHLAWWLLCQSPTNMIIPSWNQLVQWVCEESGVIWHNFRLIRPIRCDTWWQDDVERLAEAIVWVTWTIAKKRRWRVWDVPRAVVV